MRRKQQVHSGDRSHPFIRELDALTPTLSYDGWKKDARIIEWPVARGIGQSVFEGLDMDRSDVDRVMARMRLKQAECDGDRSNKGLRELDELKVSLNYDGWRRDADVADAEYKRDPRVLSYILATMRRKQQVHSGDRSHPFIRRLDALTPTLSYNGWKDDARAIEWPRNGRRYYHAHQVEEMFELMRTKQEEHDGVRDHKNLRELDDLVARLATNMQVPSASAPVPEASTSAVLWDADTLPIQRLVEEVLAGKLVCSELLGTSASSNSSEKDDSRQVSGPCDTASSGQGESSSGDRSLRQSAGRSRPAHGDRVAIDSNGLHAMPGTSRRDDGTVVAKSPG